MTLRSRFFALTYDRQMAKVEEAGLRSHRQSLLAGAAGRVLEIGAGTGGNLPFYGPAVESLTLTGPEIPMLRGRPERKARGEGTLRPRSKQRPGRGPPLRGTTHSTLPFRPWCSVGLMTSPARSGSCVACCDPVGVSSLSNTSGPTKPSWRASKIA